MQLAGRIGHTGGLLRALAAGEAPIGEGALCEAAALTAATGRAALELLRQHDVIRELPDGRLDFAVPLMRRWIRDVKAVE